MAERALEAGIRSLGWPVLRSRRQSEAPRLAGRARHRLCRSRGLQRPDPIAVGGMRRTGGPPDPEGRLAAAELRRRIRETQALRLSAHRHRCTEPVHAAHAFLAVTARASRRALNPPRLLPAETTRPSLLEREPDLYGSCRSLPWHLVGVGVPSLVGLLGAVLVAASPQCPGITVLLVAAGLGDDGAAELSAAAQAR